MHIKSMEWIIWIDGSNNLFHILTIRVNISFYIS
jgi:hypothetical protein